MVRQTSMDAYKSIKDNGLLSERRWQVYDVVFKHGPMTSGEAFGHLNAGVPLRNLTQSRARFTELRECGVFAEVGERDCKVTGHNAIVWDVTDRLPLKRRAKKTNGVRLSQYRALCAKVAMYLKSKNDNSGAIRVRERIQQIEGD
jgi:hypothetical protein